MSESTPEPEGLRPNKRLARGASMLRNQMAVFFPEKVAEGEGEPDGFGVVRSLRFTGDAGKFIAEVLPHLNDPRIKGFEKKSRVGTIVTFVDTTQADVVDRFPLDSAAVVAGIPIPVPPPNITQIEGEKIEAKAAEAKAAREAEQTEIPIPPVPESGTSTEATLEPEVPTDPEPDSKEKDSK